jgi:hypothetical protein
VKKKVKLSKSEKNCDFILKAAIRKRPKIAEKKLNLKKN